MTLRQKVGMLFVIRPDALDESLSLEQVNHTTDFGVKELTSQMKNVYKQYPCGGFAIFGKNISSEQQLKKFNRDLHNLGNILLFVDEEGGKVARLDKASLNVPHFEDAAFIAKSDNTTDIYNEGKTIGKYLKDYGFDADFAPVADINSNPSNPIIGTRAFGENPTTVIKMARAFSEGLASQKILSTYKHYPGHGDTSTDTHAGYAESLKTWDELLDCELQPFIDGIDRNIPLIMVAHICLPNVTSDKTPATLSKMLITDKLRNELGYKGLVITDALNMGAINSQYTSAEACIKALEAGVDILLMPYDYKTAFDAIVSNVESGEISEDELNKRVLKILSLKNHKLQ